MSRFLAARPDEQRTARSLARRGILLYVEHWNIYNGDYWCSPEVWWPAYELIEPNHISDTHLGADQCRCLTTGGQQI